MDVEWLVARGIASGSRPQWAEKRTVSGKSESPEKSRIVAPPSTPQRSKHTPEEVIIPDSDEDSDVVVVDRDLQTPKATSSKVLFPVFSFRGFVEFLGCLAT